MGSQHPLAERRLSALMNLQRQPAITVEIPALDAWIVLATLQLALRHPENNREPAKIARAFAEQLEAALCLGNPILTDLAREGWNPAFDSPWSTDGDIDEPRRCRVCGCTDENCIQCIEKTGHPCHRVAPDLCSACAPAPSFVAPYDPNEPNPYVGRADRA